MKDYIPLFTLENSCTTEVLHVFEVSLEIFSWLFCDSFSLVGLKSLRSCAFDLALTYYYLLKVEDIDIVDAAVFPHSPNI